MSQPDIITISSYNTPENQTASDFEAVLANTIVYPKRMILTKFVMPNWIYPFNSKINRILVSVRDSAVAPLTPRVTQAYVTIPSGKVWTTGGAFASDLTTLINTALFTAPVNGTSVTRCATPISVTFDASTGKCTIAGNSAVATNPVLPAPNATLSYQFFVTGWNFAGVLSGATSAQPSTALYKIGFTEQSGTGYNNNYVSSLVGDSLLNLLGTSVIYVSCSLIGNAQNDKRASDGSVVGDESIFATIPCNANFGEVILYQDVFGEFINTSVNSLRSIRITLLNEEYNILELPRGCYATLEFRCTY